MKKVVGNYRLIRQIGEGGFARTYEAMHIHLEEKACVKQNRDLTPEAAKLLWHEAKLLWNLNHHSLPSMRDFFQAEDGSYLLVMQFIEGDELQETITEHGAIETETVCWIAQRLLNALYYLHFSGVIHGDIKPANIIVQPETHNAIIVDYGQASVRPDYSTRASGCTIQFAAPEIIEGKPPIPESDLYSLGLTILYALGGDPIEKTIPDDVPDKLKEYLMALLRTDPLTRPNWNTIVLVRAISDLRLELFGRRATL